MLAEAATDLSAEHPAEQAADNPTDQRENRRAKQQLEFMADEGRTDTDGEQAADRADDCASQCSEIGFTETRVSHGVGFYSGHRLSIARNGRGSGPIYSAVGR